MAIYARGGDFFNLILPPPPVIVSFAPNTGGIDLTSTIILSGTAQAFSIVTVYDGGVFIGPQSSVNSLGNWQFTETGAADGVHVFTATATDANGTSGLSSPFSVTVSTGGTALTATDGTTILTATDGTTILTT